MSRKTKSKKKKSVEELLEEALVPEEEQPYPVPENWVWVRLKAINRNISRNIDPKDYKDEVFELYSVPNFQLNEPEYIRGKEIGSNKQLVKKNELLLCKINPRINRVWLVLDNGVKYRQIASTEWIVVCENKVTLPKYLLYLLRSPYFRKLLISNVSGVGGSLTRARPKEVETYPIAIPPLNEQRRIADKVEQLLNKIDQAKQLIEEAKQTFELRRAAILDKAFRGELTRKWRERNNKSKIGNLKNVPYEIPDTWKWVKLSEIMLINPPRKKLKNIQDNQKCTFIPMSAVNDQTGEIDTSELREFKNVRKGYTFFQENDILFAKITPCMENGKSTVATNLTNGFGFGSTEFHVLRVSEDINVHLIYYLVRSKKFRLKAKANMTGAVGQQRVPKKFIEEYLFPLPPKEEQDQIVKLLDHIFLNDIIAYTKIDLEESISNLKQSILSKAFRGELCTNDPTEESAIKLLKEALSRN